MTDREKKKIFSINTELFYSVSNVEFDDMVFVSDKPSLVLFGAERCAVCKELHPILEEIIPKYSAELNSYYVDIDKYKDMMQRFRLRGIPTVLLFKDGEVKERITGNQSTEYIIESIKRTLKE